MKDKQPVLKIHRGDPDRELFLLIHGWAADEKTFTDPLDINWIERDESDVLQMIFPVSYFISSATEPDTQTPLYQNSNISILGSRRYSRDDIESLWDFLAGKGYNLVTWSQFYPNRSIHHAVAELAEITTTMIRDVFPGKTRYSILTHSRGALVIRKYIQQYPEYACPSINGVYMIAPVNQGSKIGSLSGMLQDVVKYFDLDVRHPLLEKVFSRLGIPESDPGFGRYIVDMAGRLLHFIQGEAIKELSVSSEFVTSLNQNTAVEKAARIDYHIFSGTNPYFTNLYLRYREKTVSIIEPLSKLFSMSSELRSAHGDGLVAVKRSGTGFEKTFRTYDSNHITILFNQTLQQELLKIIESNGENR